MLFLGTHSLLTTLTEILLFTLINNDCCGQVYSLGIFADYEAVTYRLMHILQYSTEGDTYTIERFELTTGEIEKDKLESCQARRAKYKQEQEELEAFRADKEND